MGTLYSGAAAKESKQRKERKEGMGEKKQKKKKKFKVRALSREKKGSTKNLEPNSQ